MIDVCENARPRAESLLRGELHERRDVPFVALVGDSLVGATRTTRQSAASPSDITSLQTRITNHES